MQPTRLLILILAMLGAAGAGWLLASSIGREPALEKATVLPEPRPIAPFELRDERGEPFPSAALEGDWHLLFFGFANCPDICPITLQQLAEARRRLAERAAAEPPQILFISVDPERDSPAILAAYAAQFGSGVRAATAAPEALRRLAGELGIFFRVTPGNDAYDVSHSAAVLLLNRRGELHAVFGAPHSVDAFVHDLPIVMASR